MPSDLNRIQSAIAGRSVNPLQGFQGRQLEVVGLIEIVGAGEATVDVSFPVRFVEHPSFSFGGEMVENSAITAGQHPTISIMVLRWMTEEATPGTLEQDQQIFVGASLIIVTTGIPDQRQRAHFQVRGRGIVSPVGAADTTEAL